MTNQLYLPVMEELGDGKDSLVRYRNHIVSIQINGNHISESLFELETVSTYEMFIIPS